MLRRLIALLLCLNLIWQQAGLAQGVGQLDVAAHLKQLTSNVFPQDHFRPVHLRSLAFDEAADSFKLLLDKGDSSLPRPPHQGEGIGQGNVPLPLWEGRGEGGIEEETAKLMRYFQIGLALPNSTFWVNLRPDAPDNIIEDKLAQTDIGRIMLAADVQLKKDTAAFTSPDTPEGREYWDKLYKKAGELFGTQQVEIPTYTRPWIVPGEIIIRETVGAGSQPALQGQGRAGLEPAPTDAGSQTANPSAYIYKATLKVMLEEDYIETVGAGSQPALQGRAGLEPAPTIAGQADPRFKVLNEYSSELLRELVIPKITRAVNSAKRYAELRQVYYSLILAQWFKERNRSVVRIPYSVVRPASVIPRPSSLERIDSGNLSGLTSKAAWLKSSYFAAYRKSFKDGEYQKQETVYSPTGAVIRRYTSGGVVIPDLFSSAVSSASAPNVMVFEAAEYTPSPLKDYTITARVGPDLKINIAELASLAASAVVAENLLKDEIMALKESVLKGKKSLARISLEKLDQILDTPQKDDHTLLWALYAIIEVARVKKGLISRREIEILGKILNRMGSQDNSVLRNDVSKAAADAVLIIASERDDLFQQCQDIARKELLRKKINLSASFAILQYAETIMSAKVVNIRASFMDTLKRAIINNRLDRVGRSQMLKWAKVRINPRSGRFDRSFVDAIASVLRRKNSEADLLGIRATSALKAALGLDKGLIRPETAGILAGFSGRKGISRLNISNAISLLKLITLKDIRLIQNSPLPVVHKLISVLARDDLQGDQEIILLAVETINAIIKGDHMLAEPEVVPALAKVISDSTQGNHKTLKLAAEVISISSQFARFSRGFNHEVVIALEKLIQRQDLEKDAYAPAVQALDNLIRDNSDLIPEKTTGEILWNIISREGYSPPAYEFASKAIIGLHQKNKYNYVDERLAAVMASLPISALRHNLSCWQIYLNPDFHARTGSLHVNQKYSFAKSVHFALSQWGLDIADQENITKWVEFLGKKRLAPATLKKRLISRGKNRMIGIFHEDYYKDIMSLVRIVGRLRQKYKIIYGGDAKEGKFLQMIRKSKGEGLFFSVHGKKEYITLSDKLFISSQELADALLERGDTTEIAIFLDCCYAFNFAIELARRLKEGGAKAMPVIVASSHYDKVSFGNLFLDALRKLGRKWREGVTVGDIFELEKDDRMMSDQLPSVFIPLTKKEQDQMEELIKASKPAEPSAVIRMVDFTRDYSGVVLGGGGPIVTPGEAKSIQTENMLAISSSVGKEQQAEGEQRTAQGELAVSSAVDKQKEINGLEPVVGSPVILKASVTKEEAKDINKEIEEIRQASIDIKDSLAVLQLAARIGAIMRTPEGIDPGLSLIRDLIDSNNRIISLFIITELKITLNSEPFQDDFMVIYDVVSVLLEIAQARRDLRMWVKQVLEEELSKPKVDLWSRHSIINRIRNHSNSILEIVDDVFVETLASLLVREENEDDALCASTVDSITKIFESDKKLVSARSIAYVCDFLGRDSGLFSPATLEQAVKLIDLIAANKSEALISLTDNVVSRMERLLESETPTVRIQACKVLRTVIDKYPSSGKDTTVAAMVKVINDDGSRIAWEYACETLAILSIKNHRLITLAAAEVLPALEKLLGRGNLEKEIYRFIAQIIYTISKDNPEFITPALKNDLYAILTARGHKRETYNCSANSLRSLFDNKQYDPPTPEFGKFLESLPAAFLSHSWSCWRIYLNIDFRRKVEGLDANQKYSFANSVDWHMQMWGVDAADPKNISLWTEYLWNIRNSQDTLDTKIVWPGLSQMMLIINEEFSDERETLEALVSRVQVKYQTFCGPVIKTDILDGIRHGQGSLGLFFNVHGVHRILTLSKTENINIDDLADALLARSNTPEVTIIFDECYSFNYILHLRNKLKQGGFKSQLKIVGVSQDNQVAYKGKFTKGLVKVVENEQDIAETGIMVRHILTGINVGEAFSHQIPSVFLELTAEQEKEKERLLGLSRKASIGQGRGPSLDDDLQLVIMSAINEKSGIDDVSVNIPLENAVAISSAVAVNQAAESRGKNEDDVSQMPSVNTASSATQEPQAVAEAGGQRTGSGSTGPGVGRGAAGSPVGDNRLANEYVVKEVLTNKGSSAIGAEPLGTKESPDKPPLVAENRLYVSTLANVLDQAAERVVDSSGNPRISKVYLTGSALSLSQGGQVRLDRIDDLDIMLIAASANDKFSDIKFDFDEALGDVFRENYNEPGPLGAYYEIRKVRNIGVWGSVQDYFAGFTGWIKVFQLHPGKWERVLWFPLGVEKNVEEKKIKRLLDILLFFGDATTFKVYRDKFLQAAPEQFPGLLDEIEPLVDFPSIKLSEGSFLAKMESLQAGLRMGASSSLIAPVIEGNFININSLNTLMDKVRLMIKDKAGNPWVEKACLNGSMLYLADEGSLNIEKINDLDIDIIVRAKKEENKSKILAAFRKGLQKALVGEGLIVELVVNESLSNKLTELYEKYPGLSQYKADAVSMSLKIHGRKLNIDLGTYSSFEEWRQGIVQTMGEWLNSERAAGRPVSLQVNSIPEEEKNRDEAFVKRYLQLELLTGDLDKYKEFKGKFLNSLPQEYNAIRLQIESSARLEELAVNAELISHRLKTVLGLANSSSAINRQPQFRPVEEAMDGIRSVINEWRQANPGKPVLVLLGGYGTSGKSTLRFAIDRAALPNSYAWDIIYGDKYKNFGIDNLAQNVVVIPGDGLHDQFENIIDVQKAGYLSRWEEFSPVWKTLNILLRENIDAFSLSYYQFFPVYINRLFKLMNDEQQDRDRIVLLDESDSYEHEEHFSTLSSRERTLVITSFLKVDNGDKRVMSVKYNTWNPDEKNPYTPYKSASPVGQEQIADRRGQIEETQKQITEASRPKAEAGMPAMAQGNFEVSSSVSNPGKGILMEMSKYAQMEEQGSQVVRKPSANMMHYVMGRDEHGLLTMKTEIEPEVNTAAITENGSTLEISLVEEGAMITAGNLGDKQRIATKGIQTCIGIGLYADMGAGEKLYGLRHIYFFENREHAQAQMEDLIARLPDKNKISSVQIVLFYYNRKITAEVVRGFKESLRINYPKVEIIDKSRSDVMAKTAMYITPDGCAIDSGYELDTDKRISEVVLFGPDKASSATQEPQATPEAGRQRAGSGSTGPGVGSGEPGAGSAAVGELQDMELQQASSSLIQETRFSEIIELATESGKGFQLRRKDSGEYKLWIDGQEVEDSCFEFNGDAQYIEIKTFIIPDTEYNLIFNGVGKAILQDLIIPQAIKNKQGIKVGKTANYALIKMAYNYISKQAEYLCGWKWGQKTKRFDQVKWLEEFGPIEIRFSDGRSLRYVFDIGTKNLRLFSGGPADDVKATISEDGRVEVVKTNPDGQSLHYQVYLGDYLDGIMVKPQYLASSAVGEGMDSSGPGVGRPELRVEGRISPSPGGIDFRSLPASSPLSGEGLRTEYGRRNTDSGAFAPEFSEPALDKEWSEIERLVNCEVIPAANRLKSYYLAACKSKECQRRREKLRSCMADILRLEEDLAAQTDPVVSEILVDLESSRG